MMKKIIIFLDACLGDEKLGVQDAGGNRLDATVSQYPRPFGYFLPLLTTRRVGQVRLV
ncbi:hypothetical protein D3C76_1725590 [compost metagenome]